MLENVLFTIREATMKDVGLTFSWQIHPSIRRYSRIPNPPSFAGHEAWFKETLLDHNRDVWIFENEGLPLGQLRVDKGVKNEISILISPEYMGHGFGGIALGLVCQHYKAIDLWAFVKGENEHSIKLFTKYKFIHQYENWYLLRSHNTQVLSD